MCCKQQGCVSLIFLIERIVPVLKKSNICGSFNDLRPTTVSFIAKVFEYFFINKLFNYVSMHELQFEFKKGGECVFVAALNLTKAYDRLYQCI